MSVLSAHMTLFEHLYGMLLGESILTNLKLHNPEISAMEGSKYGQIN